MVTCPHCNGDGEEPGAPVDLDGVYLCTLCRGSGEVSQRKADTYSEESED
jgi:DnaJ-class molecular chaperone